VKTDPVTIGQTLQGWATLILMQLDLAGLVLVGLLGVMIVTLILAQRSPEFNIQQMMLDDNGKVSFLRVAGIGAFAVSSWVVMKDTISSGGANPMIFWGFVGVWSGAPVAGKLIEALSLKWSPKP
jgi:hypothetical protein